VGSEQWCSHLLDTKEVHKFAAANFSIPFKSLSCRGGSTGTCARREENERAVARELLADSNIPHRRPDQIPRTFDNFEVLEGCEAALAAAQRMARLEGPKILGFLGQPGCGKSHLLEAIARSFVTAKRTVRYDYVPDLLSELRNTYSEDSDETVDQLNQWRKSKTLLVLDDIGVGYDQRGPARAWVQEQLLTLVDERYRNGGRLAFATNLTKGQMEHYMGLRLASRLWDRSDKVDLVHMTCGDFRERRSNAS
jgi:DNA replication protein DnaC